MRTTPTMSASTGTNLYAVLGGASTTSADSVGAFQNLNNIHSMRFRIYMAVSGTNGQARWLRMSENGDSSHSITASSEL